MGLFLLLSARNDAACQTAQSLKDELWEKNDAVVQQYYFSNPDSAIILLEPLALKAEKEEIWDLLLYITINQASIASDIENFDLFSFYLNRGDSINLSFSEYIYKHDEDGYIRANLYFLFGRYYYDQFNFEEAIEQYSKVFNLKASSQDSLLAYDTYLSIGQANYSLGNFEAAQHAYKLAQISLPLISEAYSAGRDYVYRNAFINSLLGRSIYFKAEKSGDKSGFEKAILVYHVSLGLLKGKENDKSAQRLYSTLYRRIAAAHSQLENGDSAFFYVEKMFSKVSSSPVDQIQSYLLAGDIYLDASNSKIALSFFDKALDIAEQYYEENLPYKGQALMGLGKAYALQRDFRNANIFLHKALLCFTKNLWKGGSSLPSLPQIKNENEMLLLLEAMGLSAFEEYKINGNNIEQCLSIFKLASALSDQLRTGFQSPESRQLLSSRSTSIYEGGLAAAYEAFIRDSTNLNYQNTLLYFMEKNKGAQLLESSREGFAETFTGIPERLLSKENQIKGKIAYLKRILNESEKEDPALRRELDKAYRAYKSFTASLKERFPEYFKIRYETEIISIKDLQEAIPAKTLFLEYFFGRDALYLFSATQNSLAVEKIIEIAEVKKTLSTLLREIKDPASIGLNDASHVLYNLILRKALNRNKGVNQLWIVPDGPLGYLPFEVLNQKDIGNAADNFPDYLIQDYNTKYEFSGTLLKNRRNDFRSPNEVRYLGFAPDYKNEGRISQRRFDLSPLRFNREEIEDANEYFNGQTFLNKTATEENFFKNASTADILHLSMHAMADDKNPIYSAFYFNSSELEIDKMARELDENDGILHLYELYNYPLTAELAVLSACETGSGEFAKGEGIMSLGRAFQYAGCPSVVMSLWQINDKSTATIMKEFFYHLSNGKSKDEALRDAKVSFLKNPENKYFTHPYYWSAFVLVGDATPIIEKGFSYLTVAGIFISILIFLVLFFFYRSNRTLRQRFLKN